MAQTRKFSDEALRMCAHVERLTVRQTAERFGCSRVCVWQHAHRLDLKFVEPDLVVAHAKRRSFTDDELRECAAEGLTKTETAKLFNCSKSTVDTHAEQLRLRFPDGRSRNGRAPGCVPRKNSWSAEEDEIVRAWARGERTTTDTRTALHCRYSTLTQRAQALGCSLVERRRAAPPEPSHGNAENSVQMLPPDADPLWDAQTVTVDDLGEDPYLAALRRVHVLPRDEVYSPLAQQKKRSWQWPDDLRADAKVTRLRAHA